VDVSINFHIGTREEGQEERVEQDIRNFIYYLGPKRLEEMLEDESEEAIRNLIRTYKVNRIRDIQSELSGNIVDEMNEKFNEFGVFIENMVIMSVQIPSELRQVLHETTSFDVKLQNSLKKHQWTKLSEQNQENQKITKIKRENHATIVEKQHDREVAEINLELTKLQAESNQIVEVKGAEEN
jgi:hypothetical protein